MKEVIIKNLHMGTGQPKICVPVMGKTEKEILLQMENAVKEHPDLIEWRADYYQKHEQFFEIKKICEKAGHILGQIPMIFTIRTQKEGGESFLSTRSYVKLLKQVGEISAISFVDVELFMENLPEKELIQFLHQKGKLVIASRHYFHKTPENREMDECLKKMEDSGADIRKLAVMPLEKQDVCRLMVATQEASEKGTHPVVGISMGELGKITRVSGNITGSCMTFATVGQQSAPGQMTVEEIRTIMKIVK